jgi:DNA-binding response OmpR family regulator
LFKTISISVDASGMLECATMTLTCEIAPPELALKKDAELHRPIQVLLVEDDEETAELVQMGLMDDSDAPFRSEWSHNLVEAMTRLAHPGIDVIVLDLGLPESSGCLSYRAIDAAAKHRLPIVIFTSDDRSASRNVTLRLGASDYLLKHENSTSQLRRALRGALLHGRPERGGGAEC